MSREAAISKLLTPPSGTAPLARGGKSLIEEVGLNVTPTEETDTTKASAGHDQQQVSSSTGKLDEGPSILEMMMAAQREANAEKAKEKVAVEKSEERKGLGGGFKKGFFGTAKSKQGSDQKESRNVERSPSDDVITVKKAPKAGASGAGAVVFDEVQKAMEEDQHPLLKQLKSTEWMTPELVSAFKSNQVLSRGFANPKCMAAMQLLQSDPKEAQKRFANDPEVGAFLQEFGKLMAGHFEALGAAAGAGGGAGSGAGSSGGNAAAPSVSISGKGSSSAGTGVGTGAGIQELGPLHAQALQRKSSGAAIGSSSSSSGSTSSPKGSAASPAAPAAARNAQSQQDDDAKVQKILADEELRAMLMDPELQRVLVECGDPARFQHHMRDPDTRRKIMRLQQAGLVGTTR